MVYCNLFSADLLRRTFYTPSFVRYCLLHLFNPPACVSSVSSAFRFPTHFITSLHNSILKRSHKSGASKFTSSSTLSSNLLMSQFFNFQTLLFTADSCFMTFFSFLMSATSTTTNRCCHSYGITFTSRKYFLFSLPTDAKSISVSFPPALNVPFFFAFFLIPSVRQAHFFFITKLKKIFPPNFSPLFHFLHAHTFETINLLPNMPIEVAET